MQQFRRLLSDGLGNTWVGVTKRGDGNTSEPVDVLLAAWVIQPRTFAAHEHDLRWAIGRHDRTVVRIGCYVLYVGIGHDWYFLIALGNGLVLIGWLVLSVSSERYRRRDE